MGSNLPKELIYLIHRATHAINEQGNTAWSSPQARELAGYFDKLPLQIVSSSSGTTLAPPSVQLIHSPIDISHV